MKKPAVFLDRDGTINEDVGYPQNFSKVHIYDYSYEAVRRINRSGFLAVVTTNQSGIGRGLLTETDLHLIHSKMRASFASRDCFFDGIYYCPHYEQSSSSKYRKNCRCRKPERGMAIQAAADLNIDLKRSYMIGDKVEDMLFGTNIQATPILVLTGYGQTSLKQLKEQNRMPAHVAPDLLDAVNWLLQREGL